MRKFCVTFPISVYFYFLISQLDLPVDCRTFLTFVPLSRANTARPKFGIIL